ncbi:MAG: acyl transferase [Bacteroidetes bacterium GWF2_43_63]|nr:MAG: acyl transferase [Bacteroidetes bacterium GWE2_42_42]OFY55618.1 MAG: acyl transferase [Bacteroidetes bacterium GWF2_43_63]HBG71639.1 acyl transferase [Bacteroidales bacterium]HCB62172.1 acyl transferase [Bacteroidales bacterium]HCY22400.1 acyl transferase [Bacteroidales bacterium]
MTGLEKLSSDIFRIQTQKEFEQAALELFSWHQMHNDVYKTFCKSIGKTTENVHSVHEIPFLPVNLFRYNKILPDNCTADLFFETSGTTATETGRHYIADPALYLASAMKCFERFYGNIEDYVVLALLPGYLERQHSSLVYMVDHWIKQSNKSESGFYLYDQEKLFATLNSLQNKKLKTILIGVTHALTDFAEKYSLQFPELIVMETGGMKGRRKELSRAELHALLKNSFGVPSIHSEYGMTELLSQAYSKADGSFRCPPWMRVLLRDINDPLSPPQNKTSGAINIIDLANMYSCPFLATDDSGILHEDGSFKITGRVDFSVIRGCSTMIC